MVKPDGVQRGLVGEIISRFERKGFKLTGLKLFQCSKELAEVCACLCKYLVLSALFIFIVGVIGCRRRALVKEHAGRSTLIGEHNGRGAKPHFALEPIWKRTGWNRPNMFLDRLKQIQSVEHYKDLKQKSFFPKLIDYITSGPVVSMAWEGVGVVASARKLIGATDPLQAEPGTIRGDLAVQTGRNVVHGSDSPENGKREIALWFKEGELCEWTPVQAPWLRE
ncbi:hypothetical protein ACSQ67_007237 [Phaseolus vulgaris]